MNFLIRLVALLYVVHSLHLASAKIELYVRSNSSTTCPTKSCLTLDEYAADKETYFTSVTTFIFLEGKHYLNSPLWINSKNNISMKGINTNVTIIMSPNARLGLWNCENFALRSLEVQYYGCVQDISEDDSCSALMIYGSRDVELTGVKFSRFLGIEATFSKAVILQESTAHITDSSFFNGAHTCGGAFCIIQSMAIFSGTNSFVSNRALYGGAFCVGNSMVVFNGTTTFDGNGIFEHGGRVVQGGAIYVRNSTLDFHGLATFDNNSAILPIKHKLGVGGAIAAYSRTKLHFHANVTFSNNIAESGGAVYNDFSDLQLLGNATFRQNSAILIGGAIHSVSGGVVLTGSINFADNMAKSGGGTAFEGNARLIFQTPLAANFYHNVAEIGGAIFNADSTSLCSDFRPACFFNLNTTASIRLTLTISP